MAHCVFPGAAGPVIPQAAWSPVAVKTMKFIPNPTGDSDGSPNFSTTAEKTNVRDDKFGVKVDINKFGNWSVYWHFDDSSFLNPYPIHLQRAGIFRGHRLSRPAYQREQYSRHKPQHGQRTASELHSVCLLKNKPVGGLGPITDFGYVQGGLGVNPTNPALEGVAPIGFDKMG